MSATTVRISVILSLLTASLGASVFSAPASHAVAYPCSVNQTLAYGSVNSCARSLQTYLNGYVNARLVVDGNFGAATRAAVQRFQSVRGLAADGVVGPKTRDAICLSIGIPTNSGATQAQIVAAGQAAQSMCFGWGYSYN